MSYLVSNGELIGGWASWPGLWFGSYICEQHEPRFRRCATRFFLRVLVLDL